MFKSIFLLFFTLSIATCAKSQDIFHPDSILEVKLYFIESDWHNILDSLKEDRKEERLDGKAYVNGVKYNKIAVRYKGNSSYHSVERRGEKKLPLNIKFDKDFRLPGDYNRLKLANGFRDPSFVREVISYEIARKYLHAPKANFANVYVNDEYLGLYTSAEDVDKTFFQDHFNFQKGVIFKCDPDWRAKQPDYCPEADKASLMYLGEDSLCYQGLYELKSNHGWKELIALTKELNEANPQIEKMLNVDQSLWMMAFNNVLVNLDSYAGAFSHNYYLYQDSFGVFHPIVWDMNLSFGGFTLLTEEKVLETEDLQKFSLFTNYNNEKRPLASKLLKNDLYRKIYVAHSKTILEENFTNGFFKQRVDSLMAFVAPHVEKDSQKLYSLEDFHLNFDTTVMANSAPIIGLYELMDKRVEYLENHPLMQRESPTIDEIKHQSIEDQIQIDVKAAGAIQVWLCYRNAGNINFQRTQMIGGEIAGSESGDLQKWSFALPAKDIQEYYIIAEGEKAAILAPRRASKEFFSVSSPHITNNE